MASWNYWKNHKDTSGAIKRLNALTPDKEVKPQATQARQETKGVSQMLKVSALSPDAQSICRTYGTMAEAYAQEKFDKGYSPSQISASLINFEIGILQERERILNLLALELSREEQAMCKGLSLDERTYRAFNLPEKITVDRPKRGEQ